MRRIADRVRIFLRTCHQFLRAGQELAGDGVGGIGRVDQFGHVGRHRDRVSRRHRFERGKIGRSDEPGFDELRGVAKGAGQGTGKRPVHALPSIAADVSATGVQITSSMRGAPTASMTSLSRPSAMPLASGMMARAERKSSSIG